MATWQYLDNTVYVDFDEKYNILIEQAVKNGLPDIKIQIGHTKYKIDINAKNQTNLATGFTRALRRVTGSISKKFYWCFFHNGWVAMNDSVSSQLESLYELSPNSTHQLTFNGFMYNIDFPASTQTNAATGVVRKICRRARTVSEDYGSVDNYLESFMKLIPSYPLPSSFAVNFETIPLDTFVLPEDLPCVAVSGLDGDCSVCLCPLDDPTEAEDGVAVRLPCGHQFHRGCSSDWLRDKGTCPYCRAIVAVRPGGCPDGRLYVSVLDQALPGQHGQPGGAAQTLVLQFSLSGGVQDQRHPHPGVSYPPDSRVHLMPACPRGVRVLRLMVRAWALRHLFTVGLSVTRGVDDVVIYGGVHMRSQRTGPHGWPAPDFFTGVEAELAQLGVVHDDEEENKS